ncbi:Uu.00g049660.m01.CDS01 [Anthostomella pinea]|uniref:Uu.00g049660.m01.CDS01 n=1 Tax=Anthostomella pinea TaxID=933095 RepID=A0AAI8YEY2_9PEZI|nr:Uu.00g049660.m01.CDS01 [Anthostomella pinea]
MPPAKSKTSHDDAKSETASVKNQNGHGSNNHHQTNGKLRRVASSTGSQLRDVTSVNGNGSTTAPAAPVSQPTTAPGLQWSTFDRDVLHDYRREHRLDTPTAFANSYHQWVLSRPGIGLRSPTMARKQEYRRQSKDDLAKVVRKHFNGVGIQENDAIVGFLHKVRNPGVVKRRNKNAPHSTPLP